MPILVAILKRTTGYVYRKDLKMDTYTYLVNGLVHLMHFSNLYDYSKYFKDINHIHLVSLLSQDYSLKTFIGSFCTDQRCL